MLKDIDQKPICRENLEYSQEGSKEDKEEDSGEDKKEDIGEDKEEDSEEVSNGTPNA